ncbi:Oidioi.mRNA.OKI2018_I69.chr2.g4423.t1.cds [Oikopleura dioica]|uniref:Oidioi.mRNA.OKI2018_I69.chr2.g4423.t1.cds n=1 Tax=Oikopleura dioica TaxID=34765 RepID=A0ABN7T6D0_OIKDI|nr:Oidioi.mRNA.OKI2018_I69.chr2.g4423.t1.cds [Oikopleura dioica]
MSSKLFDFKAKIKKNVTLKILADSLVNDYFLVIHIDTALDGNIDGAIEIVITRRNGSFIDTTWYKFKYNKFDSDFDDWMSDKAYLLDRRLLLNEAYNVDWVQAIIHQTDVLYTNYLKFTANLQKKSNEIKKQPSERQKEAVLLQDFIATHNTFQKSTKLSNYIGKLESERKRCLTDIDKLNLKIKGIDAHVTNLRSDLEKERKRDKERYQNLMAKIKENEGVKDDQKDSDQNRCSVCFETYEKDKRQRSCLTVCGHQFCFPCVQKLSGSCPKCRKSFKKHEAIRLF